MVAPRVGAGGHPSVPRRDRALDPRRRCGSRRAHDGRGGRRAHRGTAGAARPLCRIRSRDRAPPALHHAAHGPAAPAQARARAGRAGGAAHARRHPDAPERRRGDRRGCRPPGSARARQLRPRAALRAPVGLGGRSGRVAPRGCGAAGAGARRDREAQRAARPFGWGRRRRPFLGSAPAPEVERGRGRLDGLGAKARKAAGAEPPAARSDRHLVPASGPGRGAGALGHPVRDHARRGLASAPRGGPPAGRNDCPSAQPPRLRRGGVASRRGARPPPAPGDTHAARSGMGHALSARLLGPAGHRSVRLRGVGRVPGSFRRGDLHGQGDLRRGRVRAGARRSGAGEHPALPRPLRGAVRPRRIRLGRRALRGISGRVRGGGVAPAPLGPRRLATSALDPGIAPGRAGTRRGRRDSRDRAVEDVRQPPAQSLPAGDVRAAGGRLVPAGRRSRALDGVRARRVRPSHPFLFLRESLPEAERSRQAQLPARRGRGPGHRPGPGGAAPGAARALGVAARRRDRAHAVAIVRFAPPHARVDSGGAGAPRSRSGRPGALSPDARRARARRRRGRARRRLGFACLGFRPALSRRVGALAPGRAVREPASPRGGVRARLRGGGARVPPDRAPDVEVFRAVRGPGVPESPGRQLPGGAAAGGGAPDLADQRRARTAGNRRGQRLRMDRDGRNDRAPGGLPGRDRAPRALPRPPLQLVRHERSRPARAALRLHGGQRQPRRAPDHAQAGLPRARGRAGPVGPRPRGDRRHARARARRGGGARRRQPRPGRHVPPARGGARRGPRAARARAGDCGRVVLAVGRTRGLRGDAGGHRAGLRQRGLAGSRSGPRVGRGTRRLDREPCPRCRRSGGIATAAATSRGPAGRPRSRGRPAGGRDGLHVPVRHRPGSLRDRVPPGGRHARLRPLRPARFGGAAGELRGDRARRRARRALVPPRPAPDSRRPRVGVALLVGLDVRVPHARPRARRAVGEPARKYQPPHRAPADRIRGGARRAVGNLGGGLQRAGLELHLPVLELRHQRPRA